MLYCGLNGLGLSWSSNSWLCSFWGYGGSLWCYGSYMFSLCHYWCGLSGCFGFFNRCFGLCDFFNLGNHLCTLGTEFWRCDEHCYEGYGTSCCNPRPELAGARGCRSLGSHALHQSGVEVGWHLRCLHLVEADGVAKGGYVVYQAGKQDSETILFIATGSEVSICIEAAKRLAAEGRGVRVASFPCIERFYLETTPEYRCEVMPQEMKRRVIVEAGVRYGLDRFRLDFRTTAFVTLDRFGASAPYQTLSVKFGFTPENVYNVAKTIA